MRHQNGDGIFIGKKTFVQILHIRHKNLIGFGQTLAVGKRGAMVNDRNAPAEFFGEFHQRQRVVTRAEKF